MTNSTNWGLLQKNTVVSESMAAAPTTGTIKDNAAWQSGGYLRLTSNTGSQHGEFEYSGFLPYTWVASFDFRVPQTSGADAIWFYLGDSSTPTSEDDALGGYHFAVDDYSGDNSPLQIKFNGSSLASTSGSFIWGDNLWHSAEITFTQGVIVFSIDNAALLSLTDTSFPRGVGGAIYGFAGRTGGVSSEHDIRNLLVTTNTPVGALPATSYTSQTINSTSYGLSQIIVADQYDDTNSYDLATDTYDGYTSSQAEKLGVINSTSWTSS